MTADDMVRFTRYNLLRDRSVPPLWPDDVVVRYLSEGQDRFARLTDSLIADDTEIDVVSGEDTYELDRSIIFVYAAHFVGFEGERMQPATEGWTPDTIVSSRPTRYTLDRATNTIRFYAIPDQDYTAVLRIARLPADLTLDDLAAESEIDQSYQDALMDWAAYRCFTHDDADGRNDKAAENALRRFNEMVNRAKQDNYRLRMGFQARAHGQRVK